MSIVIAHRSSPARHTPRLKGKCGEVIVTRLPRPFTGQIRDEEADRIVRELFEFLKAHARPDGQVHPETGGMLPWIVRDFVTSDNWTVTRGQAMTLYRKLKRTGLIGWSRSGSEYRTWIIGSE